MEPFLRKSAGSRSLLLVLTVGSDNPIRINCQHPCGRDRRSSLAAPARFLRLRNLFIMISRWICAHFKIKFPSLGTWEYGRIYGRTGVKDKVRGFDLWSRFSGAEQEGVVGEQNVCTLDGPIDIIP